MTRCFLGLGSNLNMPKRQLKQAIQQLRNLPRTVIMGQSGIYLSKPLGVRAQPMYYNMVVAIQTSLPAKELLYLCQAIENKQHRIRKRHWGSRTLDIDLLLYGDKSIHSKNLTIPHPHMLMRDFVLIPLLEVNPIACLPDGQQINTHLTTCENHVIRIHH